MAGCPSFNGIGAAMAMACLAQNVTIFTTTENSKGIAPEFRRIAGLWALSPCGLGIAVEYERGERRR